MKNNMEFSDISGKIIIYGARSVALGVSYAIRSLEPKKEIEGFIVSSREDNPESLGGLPVMEIERYSQMCSDKDNITVIIGTPENVHGEIIRILEKHGFFHYICIDWQLEEKLMESYYTRNKLFSSLHHLESAYIDEIRVSAGLCVFIAKSHKDTDINACTAKYAHTLQAGASCTDLRVAEYADNTGENISQKNGNYCELTALYHIWKNVLEAGENQCDYVGMFQYRRLLNIGDEDIGRIFKNRPDVILPFPTVHEPDMREHHTRYIKETDWSAMLSALSELQPDYAKAFCRLSKQQYMYNYNILIAKKEVLRDYCAWLFPILERTESKCKCKCECKCELNVNVNANVQDRERNDRYIGYIGESLMTLYFMYNADRLRIVHTGRVMLT